MPVYEDYFIRQFKGKRLQARRDDHLINWAFNAQTLELWAKVWELQTDTIATIDEFDDASKQAIQYTIDDRRYIYLWQESRDQMGWSQWYVIDRSTKNFYVSLGFGGRNGAYEYSKHIVFGYLEEGLNIIKARWNFVDACLKRRCIDATD